MNNIVQCACACSGVVAGLMGMFWVFLFLAFLMVVLIVLDIHHIVKRCNARSKRIDAMHQRIVGDGNGCKRPE